MGAQSFKCDQCSYTASVVGGLSSEFKGDTVTHVCHDCRELKDLLVRRYERGAQPIAAGPTLVTPFASEPTTPTCDRDRNHHIERWPLDEGNVCPRCGGQMEVSRDG